MPAYVLDSNILVHYVRDDESWNRIRIRFQLLASDLIPIVSVVSHGELRSLSNLWKWGSRKKDRLEFALNYFRKSTIDLPAIIDIYATIESDCRSRGYKLGKNDLWIAATAVATGSTLLTTDRDFSHVNPSVFSWLWIDPQPSSLGAP